MKLSELAEMWGLSIEGPDVDIAGVNTLEAAGPGDLTFLANARYADQLASTRAGAILVSEDYAEQVAQSGRGALVSKNVYLDMARISSSFSRKQGCLEGVSGLAFIHPDAKLAESSTVYPFAFVAAGAQLGERVTVFPNCYVGEDCVLGKGCILYPGVVLMAGTVLGPDTVIQPGAVIGGDGFGFVPTGSGHFKVPQIGHVEIGKEVEIGANTTIDRASLDVTRVDDGTKVDNLVMLAHSTRLGKNCLIVSQVGVAGSTRIGDNAVLAGQAGLVNDLTIGNNVMIGAQAGVNKDLPDGFMGSGAPIMKGGDFRRTQAIVKKLPELRKQVRTLEKEMRELKSRINDGEGDE